MLVYRQTVQYEGELPRPGGISSRLAQLLYARGARDEAGMERFLHPAKGQLEDPMLLLGMQKAAELLQSALKEKRRICVYGDYDADGVCATSLLYSHLLSLGADVLYHIPSRQEEGYGMNAAAVQKLHERGVQLIVTVDNGVKALLEISLCRELGMDVIVTDHHNCGETLPNANAIVCPTQPGDEYPNKNICGAGLALKLIQALSGEAAMEWGLPLAGLATVADVVPLLGENRAIVYLALEMINRGECPIGLTALSRAGLGEGGDRLLTSRDLAFLLAPRLNAAGRLSSASLGVELLCCIDEKEATRLAARLNQLNTERQAEEAAIFGAACELVEAQDITFKRTLVLKSPDWNSGVVGIAAARVAERYHRPTLLLSQNGEGMLTGSARSAGGLDLYRALAACEDCFIRFGGHAYAAGVTLAAEKLPEFMERFEAAMAENPEETLLPVKEYELAVELPEVTSVLAEELSRLAPFGEGNPSPLLRAKSVSLRRLRRIGNGGHVKAVAMQGDSYAEAVGFGMGGRFDELLDMERADILYTPVINEWQGAHTLQLLLKEARPAAVQDIPAYVSARREKFYDAIIRNVLYNDKRSAVCPRQITEEDICAMLAECAAGVLLACFTPEGAEGLLAFLGGRGLMQRLDVGFSLPAGPAAYHAALLSPQLETLENRLAGYRRIVLWDRPLAPGSAERLSELAENATLYVLPSELPQETLSSLRLSREDTAACYRALGERKYYDAEELLDRLMERTGLARNTCRSALYVLTELGFVSGLCLNKGAPRRELKESWIFRLLANPRLAGANCGGELQTEQENDGGDKDGSQG